MTYLLPYALSVCMIACVCVAEVPPAVQDAVTVQVAAQAYERMKMLIVVVGDTDDELDEVASVIAKDLAFSGQFAPEIRHTQSVHTKKDITSFAQDGYPLALFLSDCQRGKSIEWRLYDTAVGTMVQGKRYRKRGDIVRGWAHGIADAVWPLLTGNPASFSAKIAYCKDVMIPGKKRRTQVMVADYDGSNAQVLVATPTVNIAPRWNGDPEKPLLFYSEGTNANIRLMCVSMDGKRKVTSNFDGVNMLPSFSGDGTKVVYCASKGHGSCQLYLFEKGVFKRLTNNEGNNVSPSLSHDGATLFYCSDALTGKPYIYKYNVQTGDTEQVTKGKPSFCPSYHQPTGRLAYSALVQGATQIFMYDEKTGAHTQLTTDDTGKDECFWSPCGMYLIFSAEKGATSRLALLNIGTKEQRFITSAQERCTYPSWSPLYTEFPVSLCS